MFTSGDYAKIPNGDVVRLVHYIPEKDWWIVDGSANNIHGFSLAANSIDSHDRMAAKEAIRLGLDPDKHCYWYCASHDLTAVPAPKEKASEKTAMTTDQEKQRAALKPGDILTGDRQALLRIGDEVEVKVGTVKRKGIVVCESNDDHYLTVCLEKPYNRNPDAPFFSEKVWEKEIVVAERFGYSPNKRTIASLKEEDDQVKLLKRFDASKPGVPTNLAPIATDNFNDLIPGDRIETITGDIATIINVQKQQDSASCYEVVCDKTRHAPSSPVKMPGGFAERAAKLQLTATTLNWNGFVSDYIKRQLLPVDRKSLKVGDRITIKIDYDGKQEVVLGTVILEDTSRYYPLVCFDQKHPLCAFQCDDGSSWDPKRIEDYKTVCTSLNLSDEEAFATSLCPSGTWKGKPYRVSVMQVLSKPAIKDGDWVSFTSAATGKRIDARLLDATKRVVMLAQPVVGAQKLSKSDLKKVASLGIAGAKFKLKLAPEQSLTPIKQLENVQPTETSMIDKATLKLGDKVRFIDSEASESIYEGTVVVEADDSSTGEPILWINEEDIGWSIDEDDGNDDELLKYNANRLGLDVDGDCFWRVVESVVITKRLSKGNHERIKQSDLKVGDRIVVYDTHRLAKGTVVLTREGENVIVAIDSEDDLTDSSRSFTFDDTDPEDEQPGLRKNCRRYGIDYRSEELVELDDDITIVEKIAPAVEIKKTSIEPDDLEVGDKIEVKLIRYSSSNRKITKKVQGTYLKNGYVWFDKELRFGDYSTFTLDAKMAKTAKDLGFDASLSHAWFIDDDDEEIIRIIQRASGSTTKETNMSESKGFFDTVKEDAGEAGYRIAAKQMTKGVRSALVLTIKAKGGNGERAEAIGSVLESEIGEAIVEAFLGVILPQIPGIKDDPRIIRLAKEFRTSGMTTAGNAVLGEMMEFFLPAIKDAMQYLPPAEESTGARVVKSTSKTEETTVKNGKTMGLSS
jgi:hypothetical protein